MVAYFGNDTDFGLFSGNFLPFWPIFSQNLKLEYARLLFKEVCEPNIYLYNAIIRAYTHSHLYLFTIDLYKYMLKDPVCPDKFTYPFVIRSCGALSSLHLANQVHGHVLKTGVQSNIVIENSILDMYIRCDAITNGHKVFNEMTDTDVISWNSLIYGHIKLGQMKKARELFDVMPQKSISSWTAMISGYTRNGSNEDALHIFRMMQLTGVKPDWISLLSVLPACTQLGALELGKWIHFYAEKNGFLEKISLSNALIEMYAKTVNINQARQVFDKMLQRDVISRSTMIYFDSMKNDYNLNPGIEHYGCLVDLLGRTGCITLAFELVKTMPMKLDSAIWGSLLSSCRI
ncbi:hypothetical protein LXL04_007883 [Taraxacum kok-saghyz]